MCEQSINKTLPTQNFPDNPLTPSYSIAIVYLLFLKAKSTYIDKWNSSQAFKQI